MKQRRPMKSQAPEHKNMETQDNQDGAPWIDMPVEDWATLIVDGIMEALADGNWLSVQLGQKMLQDAFDDGRIRKH